MARPCRRRRNSRRGSSGWRGIAWPGELVWHTLTRTRAYAGLSARLLNQMRSAAGVPLDEALATPTPGDKQRLWRVARVAVVARRPQLPAARGATRLRRLSRAAPGVPARSLSGHERAKPPEQEL